MVIVVSELVALALYLKLYHDIYHLQPFTTLLKEEDPDGDFAILSFTLPTSP